MTDLSTINILSICKVMLSRISLRTEGHVNFLRAGIVTRPFSSHNSSRRCWFLWIFRICCLE